MPSTLPSQVPNSDRQPCSRSVTSALLLSLLPSTPALAEKFEPGCQLPFADIQKDHPIDDSCDMDGKTKKETLKDQNRAACFEEQKTVELMRQVLRGVDRRVLADKKIASPTSS